jgi:beta-galactosidase
MYYFGVDYYPEQWPEERWANDVQLMAEAGFNVVRLAEFAWSHMEPEDRRYDFDWLDRAIDLLAGRDIQIVLGTPTASPPPWLMAKSAELFLVRADGRRLSYGNRRGYCPSHPLYHEHSRRIVAAMAAHYGHHPAVIGWQIDNEFGDRCYCAICQSAFHDWLRERYDSLEELNERWGAAFWSHVYTDWSQIPVPFDTVRSHNPALNLDYYRFMSDTYRAYQKLQIDILREQAPQHFVTHNLMGFKYPFLNYYDLTLDLDFVSWDNYWRMQWNMQDEVDPSFAALNHDTMRGLKKKNFWVIEQQSGGGGWEMVAVPPKPGELRLWTYQSIAHGADGILYFRWRTARHGTEQHWQGVLEHHGVPGRRYREVAQVGRELRVVGETIAGSQISPQAAIMQSYDSRFAFQVQPNNPRLSYEKHIQDIYTGFFEQNIPLEIISEKDVLENYKVVVVPAMYVMPRETAENLERFAAGGGVVVFTPRTGVKDEDNAAVNMKLPGLVASMSGLEVEEYVSMPPDGDNAIQFCHNDLQGEFTASVWADVLETKGAQVVGRYTQDYYAGKAAATINLFGDGRVIYLGTMGDVAFYRTIARWVAGLAGVAPLLESPRGVEVAQRCSEKGRLLLLMNHSNSEQMVELGNSYCDLLNSDGPAVDSVTLPAKDLRIMLEL